MGVEDKSEIIHYTFDQCYELCTDKSPMSLDIRNFAMTKLSKRVGTKLLVYGYDGKIKSSLAFGNVEERGLVHMLLIQLKQMSKTSKKKCSLSLLMYEISDEKRKVCDLLNEKKDNWLENKSKVSRHSVIDANRAINIVGSALEKRHTGCHLVITLSVCHGSKQVDLDVVLLADCGSFKLPSFSTLACHLSAMSSNSSIPLFQLPKCFMTQQLDLGSGHVLLLGVANHSKKFSEQNRAVLNYCAHTWDGKDNAGRTSTSR